MSVEWLASHLNDETVRIIDASWYLPAHKRDPKAEYRDGHIPGAVYFDIDEIADQTTGLPHSLLAPSEFSKAVGALGISDQHTIVVYDGMGLFSAARVWWNFRIMGAKNVFILDGGLPEWISAGQKLEQSIVHLVETTFTASFNTTAVTDFEAMQGHVKTGDHLVLDARPSGRFEGSEAEPRAGMRSGHMPGAKNVPVSSIVNSGKLLDISALTHLFNPLLENNVPIITSCGSGVTAAILTLALDSIGHTDHSLYDGSWSEWGGRPDTPVVTG